MAGCGGGAGKPDADFAGPIALGNGRDIYMECRGSGSPTVVLVTGLGERADNFMTLPNPGPADRAVYPAVAQFTRVCAYDRPGTATGTASGWALSRSTPVQRLATVKDSADDLNLLLEASGERGPYVLVGHSLGGPIIRLYAADHPASVAALVLDDGLSEDLGDGLTPEQLANFEKLNDPAAQGRPPGSENTLFSAGVVPQLRDDRSAEERVFRSGRTALRRRVVELLEVRELLGREAVTEVFAQAIVEHERRDVGGVVGGIEADDGTAQRMTDEDVRSRFARCRQQEIQVGGRVLHRRQALHLRRTAQRPAGCRGRRGARAVVGANAAEYGDRRIDSLVSRCRVGQGHPIVGTLAET